MKTRRSVLQFLITLCNTVAITSAFGQTVYTWTGAADGTNLATAGNWTTNGINPAITLPNGTFQDIAQWDGRTVGNLVLTYGGSGWPGAGSGSLGVRFILTANQMNSVQIISTVPLSASLPLFGVTNNSPNASFALGDGTANNLMVVAWPVGAVHPFVNNSTASCTISPSVKWQAGDGAGYTDDFGGTGGWIADNYLMPDNGFFTNFVQVDGSGSVLWIADKSGSYSPTNDTLAAVTINGGGLVIQDPRVLGSTTNRTQPITNNSFLTFTSSATFNGVISGSGQLIVTSGPLTLTNNCTYTGTTTLSNGTLIINGSNAAAATVVYAGTLGGTGTFSGPVTMNPGTTLAPGGTSSSNAVGTLTINNNLTIGGNLTMDVNESVFPANDLVVVSGVLSNAGTGILTVNRAFGSPLAAGDSFTLFSKPLQNGAALIVAGGAVNWVNNLAVDGSISVSPVPFQYTWTGAANRTNLETPGNFTTDGVHPAVTLPNGTDGTGIQESVVWDGRTTSNLNLTFDNTFGWLNSGLGSVGVNFITTTNQTNSVKIISSVAQSQSIGIFAVTNNSPSAAFVFGDGTANTIPLIARPSGATHNFVNNSTAACVINPNIFWEAGGGNGYIYDFSGTGNWIVNNYLAPGNSAFSPSVVQIDGPGLVFWSGGKAGTYAPNSQLVSIVINGGGLILQSSFPFNDRFTRFSSAFITDSTFLSFSPTNGTDAQTFSNAISGNGQLIVNGGTLTLAGNNNYTGSTTVSNGTLALAGSGAISTTPVINLLTGTTLDVSGAGGSFTLVTGQTLEGNGTVNGNLNVASGATVAPGVSLGAPAISGSLNVNSGTIVANINESSSPSNTLYHATGSISSTAGTLKLLNFGPSLHANDTFKIFNQPVAGGGAMTILSPGFTVNNNLAVDGSVMVTGVQPPGSSQITLSVSGSQLTSNWPSAWTGLHLQVQTNPPGQGLGTNWITIPGTDTSNSYMAGLDTSDGSIFYRLAP